jgi:hypothetical protein
MTASSHVEPATWFHHVPNWPLDLVDLAVLSLLAYEIRRHVRDGVGGRRQRHSALAHNTARPPRGLALSLAGVAC